MCCEYVFGSIRVFGEDFKSQEHDHDDGNRRYPWPDKEAHPKSRDPHKYLNDRDPVPDEKVEFHTSFVHNPSLASDAGKVFVQKYGEEALANKEANPHGRSSTLPALGSTSALTRISSRTGLRGQGVLSKFCSDLSCDPVITRVDLCGSCRTQELFSLALFTSNRVRRP